MFYTNVGGRISFMRSDVFPQGFSRQRKATNQPYTNPYRALFITTMNLQEIPIGAEVTVCHHFRVAEDQGYWSWEQEVITGTVYKHCNESTTLLLSGTQLVSCNNAKDEIIN